MVPSARAKSFLILILCLHLRLAESRPPDLGSGEELCQPGAGGAEGEHRLPVRLEEHLEEEEGEGGKREGKGEGVTNKEVEEEEEEEEASG